MYSRNFNYLANIHAVADTISYQSGVTAIQINQHVKGKMISIIRAPYPHRCNAITLYIRQMLQSDWPTLIPITVAHIHYTLYLVGYCIPYRYGRDPQNTKWYPKMPFLSCPHAQSCVSHLVTLNFSSSYINSTITECITKRSWRGICMIPSQVADQ